MKLYNTLTKQVEEFQPLDGKNVRIYSCGPTVYDHAHIGNLSAYIFADTLHRALRLLGWQIDHAMNYTDVDDKTIRRSREQYPNDNPHEALKKLTEHYIEVFMDDMRRIGNDNNWLTFLRATDAIEAMKDLITQLHESGFAYAAEDGVYFSIEQYRKHGKKYGQLLELGSSNTSESRIQNDEYDKESAHDFALWKTAKAGEPAWEFSIGNTDVTGRPGWHIECSAMSHQLLGQPFDIHTGGIDLIFPHHENEIAQSTATTEDPVMAQFFLHNNHVLIDGKKMSKSAQNFFTLEDITDKGFDPLSFRMLVLQAHYRSQVNFTWESLAAAENRLKNWQNVAVLRWQPVSGDVGDSYDDYVGVVDGDTHSPLFDDLNTPEVLANVSQRLASFSEHLVSEAGLQGFAIYLDAVDEVLGLNLMEQPDITPQQKELIEQRENARTSKDWARSDNLRGQLAGQGISLRDTPSGTIWGRL